MLDPKKLYPVTYPATRTDLKNFHLRAVRKWLIAFILYSACIFNVQATNLNSDEDLVGNILAKTPSPIIPKVNPAPVQTNIQTPAIPAPKSKTNISDPASNNQAPNTAVKDVPKIIAPQNPSSNSANIPKSNEIKTPTVISNSAPSSNTINKQTNDAKSDASTQSSPNVSSSDKPSNQLEANANKNDAQNKSQEIENDKTNTDSNIATKNKELSSKLECLLIFDVNETTYLKEINKEKCRTLYSPAATFNIAIALMGFDAGILKNEKTIFKWDGSKEWSDYWETDHNATSWMQYSVLWYSRSIIEKIGKKRVEKYLSDFSYGNKFAADNFDNFWMNEKLKISGYGQLDFLKNIFLKKYKFNDNTYTKTKNLILLEKNADVSIYGKTSSFYIDNDAENQMFGWFIGAIENKNTTYIFVANKLCEKSIVQDKSCGKILAKEIIIPLFREEKFF